MPNRQAVIQDTGGREREECCDGGMSGMCVAGDRGEENNLLLGTGDSYG